MKRQIEIFNDHQSLFQRGARLTAEILGRETSCRKNRNFVLSGGSTPLQLYRTLADKEFSGRLDWNRINIFWGDERCVEPNHPSSNYLGAEKNLIEPLKIPLKNIHRIRGEDYPETEADRYASELFTVTRTPAGRTPVFDLILLGMGEDGHTASIFSGQNHIIKSGRVAEAVTKPDDGHFRITLTLRTINHAKNIIFLVTGPQKASMTAGILNDDPAFSDFPAALVRPLTGRVIWLLDKDAAKMTKGV